MRLGGNRSMTLDECFRVLGLRRSAGASQIKHAFRRLAKEHHPDLQHGKEDRKLFIRIVRAYRRLQSELCLHSAGEHTRPCPSCGETAELLDGVDGAAACIDCLLGVTRRRRSLPLMSITIVKHGIVILLESVGVVCLLVAVTHKSHIWAVAGLLTGLAALVVLAVTCLLVKYLK